GAGEVDLEDAVGDVDAHADAQVRVVHAVSLEPIRRGEGASRQPSEGLPRAPLGVVQQVGGRSADRRPTVTRPEGAQTLRSPRYRRPLGREIRTPRLGRPYVGE